MPHRDACPPRSWWLDHEAAARRAASQANACPTAWRRWGRRGWQQRHPPRRVGNFPTLPALWRARRAQTEHCHQRRTLSFASHLANPQSCSSTLLDSGAACQHLVWIRTVLEPCGAFSTLPAPCGPDKVLTTCRSKNQWVRTGSELELNAGFFNRRWFKVLAHCRSISGKNVWQKAKCSLSSARST